MAKIKILSARQVQSLPEGFHSDGGNLYLRVRGKDSRAWVYRFKRKDASSASGFKVVELGLGSTDDRSLAEAREIAAKMRTIQADGGDPATILHGRTKQAMTFKECALELIESKRSGWRNAKHAAQWGSTLTQYAFPVIGDKPPADVTITDVKAILTPIWSDKTETATRTRQRIEAVLDFAAVHEGDALRANPARWKGVLDKVFPAARKVTKLVHHAALPYGALPDLMVRLRTKDCMSAFCLRFTILTAARSGEARGCLWSEIDMTSKTWSLPATRMKADRPHRVPLCAEAIQLLETLQQFRIGDSDRVFPGGRGGLISDVAINKLLHGITPDVTVHGMRSSFRQWGAEKTDFPREIMESALAHTNRDQVEAAYQRSDFFDKRRQLMDQWGDFCRGNA